MLRALAPAAVVMLASACAYECGFATCANGCCQDNTCYEGLSVKNGLSCSGGAGGGGGGTGGGGGGGATGGGLGGGSGTSCVDFDNPCKASLGLYCCDQPNGTYNLICKSNEKCGFCYNPGQECSPSSTYTTCCPGTSCLLKPGFNSIYVCR